MTTLDPLQRTQSREENKPSQKEDVAQQSLILPRRYWLMGGLGAAASLAVAEGTRRLGAWHVADIGIGAAASLQRNVQIERAKLAQAYRENPEVGIDVPRVARLFLMCELMSFYRSNLDFPTSSFDDFSEKHIEPFFARAKNQSSSALAKARRSGETQDVELFGTDTVTRIVALKKALFDQMGEHPRYWACRNNIFDPILSGDLNCRSGTWLLALAALDQVVPKLHLDEKLVLIHTNTHVQFGLLTADRRLIAFEMTADGKAIQDYGPLESIDAPILICDATYELFEAALGSKVREEHTVILNQIPEEYKQVLPSARSSPWSSLFSSVQFRAVSDTRGFSNGGIKIPTNPIPISSIDYLPFAGSGVGSGMYDSLERSDPRDLAGMSLMTPAEKRVVRDFRFVFDVFQPDLEAILGAHRRLHSDDQGSSKAEDVKLILTHGRKLVDYYTRNDVGSKHAAFIKAYAALAERTGTNYSLTRNPLDILRDVLRRL